MEINRNMMEGLVKIFKQDFVHFYRQEEACLELMQLAGRINDYNKITL